MTGLLSLPSELLSAIIETCASRELCLLRATCKVLNEHADPIVFRRLKIHSLNAPHVIEHQISALATQSSKACEFTKVLEIDSMEDALETSEQSWDEFGPDLRFHLPTAISTLRNLTRFRWHIEHDPEWLIDSLLRVVARLPKLTELAIWALGGSVKSRIPLSQFANLSRLSVWCGSRKCVSCPISEVATVIANSPQLSCLDLRYMRFSRPVTPIPTLSALFAKIPTNNPLCLKYLTITSIDATIDQTTLPHLLHLTSFVFCFYGADLSIPRNVWSSFLDNNIKLSDVVMHGSITEEAMLYLSSFSGLKSLVALFDNTRKYENMLEAVLPKHAKSLQKLRISGTSPKWFFENQKLIMNCLILRDLYVDIDGEESGMSVQLLLDTVAHLPELEILRFSMEDSRAREELVQNFKPSPGLRYVEELSVYPTQYVLERDGGRVRYRVIEGGE